MLEILKFVQGAIAKKEFVPALSHFRINEGKVLGYNGAIALCSPIDLNLRCNPKALPFIKAIQTCKETVQLHLTPSGKLSVKSGPFSAFVDCLPEEAKYPEIHPEGEEIEIDGETLISTLKQLAPFIAEDASRPWARGILLRSGSVFVTNNIIIVEKWLGIQTPDINIPIESVTELVRIGEAPSKIQATKGALTFHFANGRWLRSQLQTTEWPDVRPILDQQGINPQALPDGFFKALDDLLPFLGELDRCFFLGNRVTTDQQDGVGASVEIAGLPDKGCWNLKQLQLLKNIVDEIDFTRYPQHAMFFGENLRGCMAGMIA